MSVEARIVKPRFLADKIFSTGTLLANEEVELRPEISGRVTGVFFEEGKAIAKGALMLKIDDGELRAQQKRKALEEKQASDEEQRRHKLFGTGAISQEEYDRALTALNLVQAEKEVIESQLAKTESRAPFTGVVGLRYVSEGGYVSPDMLVATMQELNPMKVEFSVPEKYAGQIRNGTAIVVRVGESETQHEGVVYATESRIDTGTRTIKVRGRIPNPSGDLIPGSFAKVELTLDEQPNAIVVPSGAVIPTIDGNQVYVCVGGKAHSVAVKTGIRTETGIQITAGLNADDTLIVTGLLQVADGKAVQIKTFQND